MIEQCFTVYDSAAKAFLSPFTAPTIESAIRSFREVCNKPGHQFNKFPEDYTLYHVGSFDQETGTYSPQDPHSLGVAVTFVERNHFGTSAQELEADRRDSHAHIKHEDPADVT